MNTKTLLSTLIGGIVLFLLGWLIYGMLLTDYMMANTAQCIMLPMEEFNPMYMLISNLLSAYVVALILTWSNSGSAMDGFRKAAMVGLFSGIAMAFSFESMSTYYNSISPALVDAVIWAFMLGVAGAAMGWFMNRGK